MRLKSFVLTTVAILVSAVVLAQSDMDERKFRFGLTAAPNLGWIRPNIKGFEDNGFKPGMGFGYGLIMDYKFSESANYLFSTGLNIANSSGRLTEPMDSLAIYPNDTIYYTGKVTRSYNLQYVNVPILLKMRTNEIGYMTYFGAFGFDLGFRTRTRISDKYQWVSPLGSDGPQNLQDVNYNSRINFLRLALNLKAGAEYNLSGNTNIYFGLSWHNTFTNVFRSRAQNKILVADQNGYPEIDSATGIAITGAQKKALTNYVSLDLGVFF